MLKKIKKIRTAKPKETILNKIRARKILVTWKVINRGLLSPLFVLCLVLFSAWNFRYWQGWFYGILNMLVIWLTMYLLRNKESLVEERLKPGEGVKTWDRWFFGANTVLTLVMVMGSAMDAGHIHVSPPLPFWVYGIGLLLFAAGHGLFLRAKTVNNWFSSMVRIQSDRGQEVCSAGPYRLLRHPGYAGGILFTLGTPLLLGSFWGLIPALLSAVLLVVRTGLEDRTLKAELKGYKAYCRKVRYRIIPRIW